MFVTRHSFAIGLATWLASSAAHALTADQVWQGWQDNATGVGLLVTSDPATTVGGQLALRNLQLSIEGDVIIRLPELTLTESADGAVKVGLPASFDIAPPATELTTFAANVTQTGLDITVTEPSPGARKYTFDADDLQLDATISEMVDLYDGGPLQPDTYAMTIGLGGLTGSYDDVPGTNRSFTTTLAAKTMEVSTDQDSPYAGKIVDSTIGTDVALMGSFTLPATFDLTSLDQPAQFADALRDGLAATLDLSQGDSVSDQTAQSDFFSYTAKITAGASKTLMSFDKAGLSLTNESEPIRAVVTLPETPFETIDVGIGTMDIAMKMPVVGPEVQDFRFMMRTDGITVNDPVWDALDPTHILARTPILIDIDVTGRTSLDLFGLVQAEEEGTIPPVPQVERADIVRLLIAGAGAELAGTGAFTFDNAAGYPLPRGNADLKVTGANRMIDALISLGFITSEDAMGARMAMALILEPTPELDVMTSKIEAREDGGLYVNGQRMQ